MLTEEKNKLLTQVGPGTPMGNLLRRYWMPIAGVSEFDSMSVKPMRLMGEDLVLYKDLSGQFGLIDRHCAHRRADMLYGMAEKNGLRCSYHGWSFNETGQCVDQPFEDVNQPGRTDAQRPKVTAYPVQAKGGMLWAYMGPLPAPQLPDWEAFSWTDGYSQIVLSEVPCNWFQCQENSIDPVHFEWMHETWGKRLRTGDLSPQPRHLKLAFDEFEYGFTYRRVKEDSGENDDAWTIGRVCLWPNGFFLGEHFEWRVPIDDENTLNVTWKYTPVPQESKPYVQKSIPTWYGPIKDEKGEWINTHVINQDFLAWVGQGVIADRTREVLGSSDRGIVAIRRRFFEDLDAMAAGGEIKGLIHDPAKNVKVKLPMMDREQVLQAPSRQDIVNSPRLKLMYTSFIFQAGQPEWVRQEFSDVIGLPAEEFTGIVASRNAHKSETAS